MTAVITIANQKGGVSKTTTTRHLAYFLEQRGKRVLAIDNDHQGNLTQYFGYNPIEVDATTGSMFHVYIEERPLRDIILGIGETVKLAPASLSLAEAGARLALEIDSNGALRHALKDLLPEFDVVLIDCGPNLERLLINALMASLYVLIPTKTDALSTSGIPALVQTVTKVRRQNPALQILGVLPTIYHRGRTADDAALRDLQEQAAAAGVRVFSPIPAATNYDKAAAEQRPVFELFPETAGRREYEELAEVISNL
jgi:chromosome partitioning protein